MQSPTEPQERIVQATAHLSIKQKQELAFRILHAMRLPNGRKATDLLTQVASDATRAIHHENQTGSPVPFPWHELLYKTTDNDNQAAWHVVGAADIFIHYSRAGRPPQDALEQLFALPPDDAAKECLSEVVECLAAAAAAEATGYSDYDTAQDYHAGPYWLGAYHTAYRAAYCIAKRYNAAVKQKETSRADI